MGYFFIIFLILNFLIFSLDRYFYLTITKILEINNLDSSKVLNSLGFYNKSIFLNKSTAVLISILILLIIFLLYKINEYNKKKILKKKIKSLEEDLVNINKGNYSLKIEEEDEFSRLRDEISKIIINIKSLEEESKRQKISLKKDLSNIAHQLKTPITSIEFMSELMEVDNKNSKIYLEKLNMELEKLNNFTELLLKLSKINYNAIDYKYIEVSLKEVINEIIDILNINKKINIEYIGEDFLLKADEVWIYEAFLNIIKNSIDHSRNKLLINFESNPIYKKVKISDDGYGMDEKELDRIFDRFYRGDKPLPGYGIGLNLAKTIIEDHNGEIKAYNEKGLTFEIKFYNVT